jgi:hypothetical protein
MHEHPIIDSEWAAGRDDETVVRRLYSVELPFAFENERGKYFDVIESCSRFLNLSVLDIKVAGSAQTGYSFHSQRPFDPGNSDLDLAVISERYFERLLRAAQKAALPNPDTLERPRRNAFPELHGQSAYNTFMENVAFYGRILPHHLPDCDERRELFRVSRKLSNIHSSMFKEVTIAIYLSQYFFERRQRPNLGIYRQARKGQ